MKILKISKSQAGTSIMMTQLQKTFDLVLFEARKGIMYFVLFHHRYIDYNQAAKLEIGPTSFKDGYYYYYERPTKQKVIHHTK